MRNFLHDPGGSWSYEKFSVEDKASSRVPRTIYFDGEPWGTAYNVAIAMVMVSALNRDEKAGDDE